MVTIGLGYGDRVGSIAEGERRTRQKKGNTINIKSCQGDDEGRGYRVKIRSSIVSIKVYEFLPDIGFNHLTQCNPNPNPTQKVVSSLLKTVNSYLT